MILVGRIEATSRAQRGSRAARMHSHRVGNASKLPAVSANSCLLSDLAPVWPASVFLAHTQRCVKRAVLQSLPLPPPHASDFRVRPIVLLVN
jgi:hypothetical protein